MNLSFNRSAEIINRTCDLLLKIATEVLVAQHRVRSHGGISRYSGRVFDTKHRQDLRTRYRSALEVGVEVSLVFAGV